MTTKKTLKIGRSDFKTIINDNGYVVDKTMLIKKFYDNDSYVLLIPRPRRFGKTLNLSMIEHFFDIQKPESRELFSEFEISKYKDFCEEHQNKYPVINISLKDVKESNWEDCQESFKTLVSELYKKHNYLLSSDKLSDDEKELINDIILEKAKDKFFKFGLQFLSGYLHKHFEKEVIILVDEYDAPIINAFNNTNPPIKSPDKENKTYYEKVISFMQTFLGKAYKGNPYLKKGLLTGVMRVGKESIFSEWNNFSVFGIISPYFSDSFGFTKEDIKKILSYFGLEDKEEDVKKWYNGYKFGNTDSIYNPWSIVNYVARENEGFKPYWVNSGDYSLIQSRITESGVQEDIQALIKGKTIEKELHENFVFQHFETGGELFWTLLTDNGYLTQVEEAKYGNHKLRIPNNEIKIVFTSIILEWLNEKVKIKRELLINTSEHLINNRIEEFEKGFKQLVGDTFSYYDTAEKTDKYGAKFIRTEQIYHVYTLGLLSILKDDYIVKSNKESGEGRYDIMLIPYDKSANGIVIEIKSIEKQKESEKDADFIDRINNSIEEALKQIETNKYYAELLENNIKPENIIKIAMIFVGKEPYIKKIMKPKH